MPRIGKTWRWNALVLSTSRSRLHAFCERFLADAGNAGHSGVRIDVDVDPSDLL